MVVIDRSRPTNIILGDCVMTVEMVTSTQQNSVMTTIQQTQMDVAHHVRLREV